MIRLKIEQYYPLAGAIIASIVANYFNFKTDDYPQLVSNTLTITAIFIGFMGTLAGILLGTNSKVITFMIRIGKLSAVMRYIWRAIHMSFVFIAVSFFLLVGKNINQELWSLVWVFFGLYSILLTHRGITVAATLNFFQHSRGQGFDSPHLHQIKR